MQPYRPIGSKYCPISEVKPHQVNLVPRWATLLTTRLRMSPTLVLITPWGFALEIQYIGQYATVPPWNGGVAPQLPNYKLATAAKRTAPPPLPGRKKNREKERKKGAKKTKSKESITWPGEALLEEPNVTKRSDGEVLLEGPNGTINGIEHTYITGQMSRRHIYKQS